MSTTRPTQRRALRKAIKLSMVTGSAPLVEKFRLLQKLGFEGVELECPSELTVAEIIHARDATGVTVIGVASGGHERKPLTHADPQVRAEAIRTLEAAIRVCARCGGSLVIFAPGLVDDSIQYQDAYERSQEEIRKLVPLAEESGVALALENVWNNFLLSPLEAQQFVDAFGKPTVGWCLDVANVLRYGWPEQWVRILGKRILKVDINEYSLRKGDHEGVGKGFDVELLAGDCDWSQVMAALEEIGYRGWGTADIPGGGRDRLRAISERMDRVFQA